MSYLVDTNILLRSSDPEHSMFNTATNATDILLGRGEELYITPQNIIEFWNVSTRPKDKNGLGYSLIKTQSEVTRLKSLFPLLIDTNQVFIQWERLVNQYQVKGVNVHDARLVAVMLAHQIQSILTFNVDDFQRYSSEITVVNPNSISS
jgi:predicted nucleic acid-binding protein